ncbi:MAG: TraM recognition domain-containing protein [Gammaproteobacteria bacterium]|nr:TraM recognition domain-containing protein [Gammaproteobacteria bacterium]
MAAFAWGYLAFAMSVNTLLVTVFVAPWGVLLALPTILLAWAAKRALPKKINYDHITGLSLGKGIDLDNPDKPKIVPVILEDEALNLGFLAIGGPKSGKTVAAIVVLLYITQKRQEGWAYFEGKGDKDIYQQCVSCGAVPDKFFSSELPSTDTLNVFSGPTESVIDRLTQVLIISDSEYYKTAQRAALRAVVPLIKALDKPAILRDLYVVFSRDEAAQYVINLAKEQGVAADTIEVANAFFSLDAETRKNDINGLLTRMSLFVTGGIADRLNAYAPTLDMEQASKENLRVYLHMPYTNMAKDIGILLTEQVGVISQNRQLYESNRTPWPLLFDDWGSFFYSNIGPITARCRSAKMPVSFLFQSKGQTDRVEHGNHFTTEVTDNIGGLFVLRVNGNDTAKWAAQQFGEYESKSLNVTDNKQHASQGRSTRWEPRIQPSTLKNLNAGEAMISCLVSGENGASENKRYKARFPLPDFSTADSIDWPVVEAGIPNDECEGLHLWRDFMDRDRLAQLQQEILSEAVAGTDIPVQQPQPMVTDI